MDERCVCAERDSDMATSTRELVELALELSGAPELPADSAVYVNGSGLSRILFGIDIAGAELMLAQDTGCDAVIAHHPAGGDAMLHFPEVLHRHVDLMVEHGVDRAVAREAVQPIITTATMRAHASNFDHVPSIARRLRIPFLNIHLPLDEIGRRIMDRAIHDHIVELDRAPSVQDALDALMTIPELARASLPIMVPVGAVDKPLGKFAVVHGAGTNGGARIARAYFEAGIGTVIYIHCSGADVLDLQKDVPGNLIVTGHIASDMIGINRYVDVLESRGIEVVRISGL